MKKLISIGVALALLAMVVLPVAVGAANLQPSTNAKIPFAIVQSGFYLVGCLMGDLDPLLSALGMDLGFPLTDLTPIMFKVGDWAGVPLAWSVDMLAWGVGVVGDIVSALGTTLGLPDWIGTLLTTLQDDLTSCWSPTVCNNVSAVYVTCDLP